MLFLACGSSAKIIQSPARHRCLRASLRTQPGRLAHILRPQNELVPFVDGLALVAAGPIIGGLQAQGIVRTARLEQVLLVVERAGAAGLVSPCDCRYGPKTLPSPAVVDQVLIMFRVYGRGGGVVRCACYVSTVMSMKSEGPTHCHLWPCSNHTSFSGNLFPR